MLSEMKYLNISTEMAQISIHQEQPHSIKNTFRPAELHRNYDPPLADVAATQVDVDIDTYNARKAYGFLNNEDFARKYGSAGYSDVQATTSAHSRSAWNFAKNGAKPGNNLVVSEAKSKLWSKIVQWPKWDAVKIPDPEFTVHPSEIKGRMDPGSDTTSIEATATAETEIQPGSAQTTLASKGYVRQWISVGRYDMRV